MTDYQPEIEAAAKKYGLDPDLVTAVVVKESSGRTNAYRYEPDVWGWFKDNPKNQGFNKYRAAASYGLMQVLFATATDYGWSSDPEYFFLPKVGLDMGCRHLAELIRWAKGDLLRALEAYNGGKGNANGKGADAEYARDVLAKYHAMVIARNQ